MKKITKAFYSLGVISATLAPLATLSCSLERQGYDWGVLNEKIKYLDVNSPIGKFEDHDSLAKLENIKGNGSSSVLPAMSRIMPAIPTFQYEGTGSGEGLDTALALGGNSGMKTSNDFGMTSSMKNPPQGKKWDNVRTVTWAVDAIGIALNLPLGVYTTNNERPIIKINELAKLYSKEITATSTWGKILVNVDKAKSDAAALAKTPIIFGRQGGKSASGTADGFWHTLSKYTIAEHLKPDLNHDNINKKGGQTTAEANAAALNAINYKPGAITYLSLGYAVQNQSKNMVLATIQVPDASNPGQTVDWTPSIANVKSDKYLWRRPFNMLYSVKNEKARRFASLLLSTEGQQVVAEQGFIPLSKDQMKAEFEKPGSQAPFTRQLVMDDLKDRTDIDIAGPIGIYNKNLGLQV